MADIDSIKQKLHDMLAVSGTDQTITTGNTFSTKILPSKNSFKMPLQLTVGFDDEKADQLIVKLDNDQKVYGFTLNKKQTKEFVKFIKTPKKALKESAIPSDELSEEDVEFVKEVEDHLREMQDNLADYIADIETHPDVHKKLLGSLNRVYEAYEAAIEQTLDLQ